MALDQLLAALEREARAAADEILASARAEASALAADVEAELAGRREAALETLERDLDAELQADLSAARLAARSRVLRARDRMLARVFEALAHQTDQLATDPAWLAALPGRLEAARACFAADTPLRCCAPPALLDSIRDSGKLPSDVVIEAAPTMSVGFRLATVDGGVEVIDTIADRIASHRPELARRALERLGFAS